ncbi:MAG: HIT domain-containing protein [Acidimicrobiaceae bacterium]|nr:HIT domain-containing protein [Acidimicrobiaceae bacterium]MBT5581750.1 HIT domain-containing protein [Acidimicrobiaceae bacterium]MBT5849234.1 HIT domain-containing protein [Acidimicrobiaceae bacterium]
MVEHLWAGWRMAYVETGVEELEGSTVFEVILDSNLPDEETFIVWRGEECFAVMNLHPYTSGHVMVLPKRAVAELADLTDNESAELWEGVRAAVAAVTAAFSPHGINVGANLGRGAGAGIPDHLHIHVVPRWDGDTNFMTTIANTRVLPEAMIDSWRRIVAAWP